ncbi:MAG: DUF58 domain-containing protein [Planctomycetes bacterium]|nr:DUF58 domain-containing protein [Planctomycetota bacterium]
MEDYQRYLEPATLNKIDRLELKARLIVEGFIAGLHKSPYHGFSVEFAEHREYVPGDDIRHVDWKVYGKSDRYYIKQYEEETNLALHILLDMSESMAYGSGPVTKFEYASYVAASLAHLVLNQRDSVGLALFDDEVRQFVRASSHPSHINVLLREIDRASKVAKTDMAAIFHDVAERISKRGIVIVISDFFDGIDSVVKGLRHFRHKGHDVICFHILDPFEASFPFERMTLFEGLEAKPEILANPRAVRKAYLEEVNRFLRDLRAHCLKHRIDYKRIQSDEPLDVALSTYLAARAGEAIS